MISNEGWFLLIAIFIILALILFLGISWGLKKIEKDWEVINEYKIRIAKVETKEDAMEILEEFMVVANKMNNRAYYNEFNKIIYYLEGFINAKN